MGIPAGMERTALLTTCVRQYKHANAALSLPVSSSEHSHADAAVLRFA